MVERYLRRAEVNPDSTWRLLRWLVQRGADEFSLDMLSVQGRDASHLEDLDRQLAPFSRGQRLREHISAPSRNELVRPTQVWSLNEHTESILTQVFKSGLFAYPALETPGGWVERPCVYRDGDLVLTIISHESEGMLRLSTAEFDALSTVIDLPLHERGEWI